MERLRHTVCMAASRQGRGIRGRSCGFERQTDAAIHGACGRVGGVLADLVQYAYAVRLRGSRFVLAGGEGELDRVHVGTVERDDTHRVGDVHVQFHIRPAAPGRNVHVALNRGARMEILPETLLLPVWQVEGDCARVCRQK